MNRGTNRHCMLDIGHFSVAIYTGRCCIVVHILIVRKGSRSQSFICTSWINVGWTMAVTIRGPCRSILPFALRCQWFFFHSNKTKEKNREKIESYINPTISHCPCITRAFFNLSVTRHLSRFFFSSIECAI